MKPNYFIVPGITLINEDELAQQIQNSICSRSDILREDLLSNKRLRIIVDARRLIAYLIEKNTERLTLREIGYYVGRDHSVVIYYVSTVKDLIRTDPEFSTKVQEAANRLMIKC